MLRESQAMLRKGIRELEREREKMQREEKKLQVEMKYEVCWAARHVLTPCCRALAKKGQLGAARIMAKDLIRTRNAISKFHNMRLVAGSRLCRVGVLTSSSL